MHCQCPRSVRIITRTGLRLHPAKQGAQTRQGSSGGRGPRVACDVQPCAVPDIRDRNWRRTGIACMQGMDQGRGFSLMTLPRRGPVWQACLLDSPRQDCGRATWPARISFYMLMLMSWAASMSAAGTSFENLSQTGRIASTQAARCSGVSSRIVPPASRIAWRAC